MKCKRLSAAILSLVMIISLLPTTALAANESTNYEPSVEFLDGIWKHTLTVKVYYEGGKDPVIEKSYSGWGTAKVVAPSGMEVYSTEGSTGGFYTDWSELFSFTKNNGTLNLYLRSKAGHTVTVNYVYTDDESKNGSKSENVKYAEEKPFGKLDKDYGYEITVSSGDAKYEVNSLDVLRVTGGAENSEITVTYTPKDVIYIDQYYDNGSSLVKWNNTHITLNGPELLNGAAEAAVIEGEDLTDAVENYRFLPVNGVTYDFSFASLVPRKDDTWVITDLWYKDEADPLGYHWFYSHSGKTASLPFGKTELSKGSVNFCYNTPHTEKSKHHDFVATTTVEPTCTERGYTDYECRYCGKEGQREYVPSLGGHLWGDYKQDKNTKEKDSQHYQVCQRKGCNATSTPVSCNFVDTSIETGTRHTCKDCGYYYDESAPKTETVYVYFRTVNTKNELVKVESGVTYNANGSSWATLGKLTTEQPVSASTDKTEVGKLGKEVKKTNDKFEEYLPNENLNLDLIKWVELKQDNGAAGYESEAPFGTHVWHLDGQVNVYKLSYDANRPAGVTADVTVPDSAYYLPGWNATVSTADPTLQGYDFGGWYTEKTCEHKVEKTVTVSEDTVLYAKWTPAQPTADLIDDNIIIKHGVTADPEHGANSNPEHGDDTDSTAHIVKKNATISYQATLDMQSLKFGANPEHADDVSNIQRAMTSGGVTSLWEFMEGKNITTFAGSKVNLYVKFDENLNVTKGSFDNIKLTSDWFQLDKTHPDYLSQEAGGYWKIPCVIKAEKGTNNSSIITLSGITLPLTADAQGKLNSNTALDIISEGYIDGTIMISMQALKLEGKSKEAPAKNTAKLKLAVPTYTVTYDGNGADSGKTTDLTAYATGAKATVKENNYTRGGYTFTGWNTSANGSGDSYKAGEQITMNNNVVLYAQWTRNSSHGGDDDDKYFFAIQKVDAQDGHALNGAKFELYQLDKNDRIVNRRVVETTRQSSKSGIALFSVDNKKSYDGIWYYAEVSAPEGYVLDRTEYEINHKDFSDSLSTAVKYADTVRNYRGTTPDLLNDSDHFAYVIGYMDGNVRPYGLISRAETTTIFFRLLKDSVRDGNLLTSNTYTDVADDYWANTAISTMTGLGIVQGRSTTTFDPKAPITRAQFAAICARFDTGKSNGEQTFSDISGHWAEKYIQRAAELGWIKGFEDGTFRPDTYITRAQAMTMINRVLNRIPEDESDLLPGMNVWPDCNPGDWFYLAVQEATNSHDFEHKAGNYETWTKLMKNPDWTRYEN